MNTHRARVKLQIVVIIKIYISTQVINQYFRSTMNEYSLISHEWWVSLIKFIVRPTIHVRGGITHLFVLREY